MGVTVAAAAYEMSWLDNWADYTAKIEMWVAEAAQEGAQLLVFPEYGALELSTLAGRDVALDLERSLHAVAEHVPAADALHADLAKRFGVHILAASAPVFVGVDRPVNRARFFGPQGFIGHQDKQIMTKFERDPWKVVSGGPLQLFETDLGKIGILICYDSEFPLLGRALKEADMILVPSCTESLAGYSRVRIGAMARALEGQCVSVMSSTVGACVWSEAVDMNTGGGGVFGPPDLGFPDTGVIAQGALNQPGWTCTQVELDAIARVRVEGSVAGRDHWGEQSGRDGEVTIVSQGPQSP